MNPFTPTLLSTQEVSAFLDSRIAEAARLVAVGQLNYDRAAASHAVSLAAAKTPATMPQGMDPKQFDAMMSALPKNSEQGLLAAWVELKNAQSNHAMLLSERSRLVSATPSATATGETAQ